MERNTRLHNMGGREALADAVWGVGGTVLGERSPVSGRGQETAQRMGSPVSGRTKGYWGGRRRFTEGSSLTLPGGKGTEKGARVEKTKLERIESCPGERCKRVHISSHLLQRQTQKKGVSRGCRDGTRITTSSRVPKRRKLDLMILKHQEIMKMPCAKDGPVGTGRVAKSDTFL